MLRLLVILFASSFALVILFDSSFGGCCPFLGFDLLLFIFLSKMLGPPSLAPLVTIRNDCLGLRLVLPGVAFGDGLDVLYLNSTSST